MRLSKFARQSQRGGANGGFTLVELLIVIVVIAILAAISIVTYNGIQDRAHDMAIQNDLSNFKKRAEAYRAAEGVYPGIVSFFNDDEMAVGISPTKQSYDTDDSDDYNLYYCIDEHTLKDFGIAARSKSGQTFTISSKGGIEKDPGYPSWGVACGAFGATSLDDADFNYGYHAGDGEWNYGL